MIPSSIIFLHLRFEFESIQCEQQAISSSCLRLSCRSTYYYVLCTTLSAYCYTPFFLLSSFPPPSSLLRYPLHIMAVLAALELVFISHQSVWNMGFVFAWVSHGDLSTWYGEILKCICEDTKMIFVLFLNVLRFLWMSRSWLSWNEKQIYDRSQLSFIQIAFAWHLSVTRVQVLQRRFFNVRLIGSPCAKRWPAFSDPGELLRKCHKVAFKVVITWARK